MHVSVQDAPVYNDVQAPKGLDDILNCPLHLGITCSQIRHNRQAVLHLVYLHSMADTTPTCVAGHSLASVLMASTALPADDLVADQ